jgi:alpha-L-fucosidase 2
MSIGHGTAITVYVDGAQRATAQATTDGITGCTTRSLRFAADQGGGQRLTGSVDRDAIFAKKLTNTEVATWRDMAF